MQEIDQVVDHLFRHRAGQMVATLTRIFGPENLPLAEEVVQEALLAALTQWSFHGVPDNPAGWLFRVARNKALDQLRRQTTLRQKEPAIVAALTNLATDDDARDDTLSMMLMCCHPSIPEESRIALTLKTVGGFSIEEIAHAFLAQKTTIAQRIVRAKKLIRECGIGLQPDPARVASLLKVIYLIFNEGHSAHEGDALVRSDLCDEAIRLASLLLEWRTGNPACHALLSLMLLQAARLPARVDACGDIAILAEQDRSLWNQELIARGMRHLAASASGDEITTYHVEAAIAACHAAASSFEETDWQRIVSLYDDLLDLNPSPVAALNRAVAVAMAQGPGSGIRAVESIAGRDSLRDYPLLYSTLGELWLRSGDRARAAEEFSRALELPSTMPEKRFLLRKLEACR
jgi:RNA polymerase sigma-70 factor, ECF subfamily